MPKLDHTGPGGKGPKSGRKLGKCRKTPSDLSDSGVLGKGRGAKNNSESENCSGKGLRKKYFTNK
jgi:hypothetical protein